MEVGSLTDEVVDLWATWGAGASVGAAELFQVLSEFDRRRPVHLLRSALGLPESLLEPELRAELSEVLECSGPDADLRFRRVLERLGSTLEGQIMERLDRLHAELPAWLPLVKPGERGEWLAGLWRADASEDTATRLVAVQSLEELRCRVEDLRKRKSSEIRGALDAGAEGLDTGAREGARLALDSGNSRELAGIVRSLAGLVGSNRRPGQVEQLADARRRIVSLCEQGRSRIAKEHAADPVSKSLIRSAVETAEAMIDGDTASLEVLETWQRAMGAMLAPDSQGSSASRIESLARTISEELVREQTGPTDSAPGGRTEATADAVLDAAGQLQASRLRRAESSRLSEGSLRKVAAALAAELEHSAGSLPAERVARARLLLDRVEEVVAGGVPEEARALQGSVEQEIEEIPRIAAEVQSRLRGRGEKQRRRVATEIERLLTVAHGRSGKELFTLGARMERTGEAELNDVEAQLREVARPVRNAVRLEAARILGRLQGGNAAPAAVERLAEALANDDLTTAATLNSELRGAAAPTIRWSGPTVWIVLSALAVTALVGLFLGGPMLTNRARSYKLVLLETPGKEQRLLQVKLVVGDRVEETAEYRPDGVSFDLKPGRYEIFVADRFTGHVIHVPDDPTPITDIPVPSDASGP